MCRLPILALAALGLGLMLLATPSLAQPPAAPHEPAAAPHTLAYLPHASPTGHTRCAGAGLALLSLAALGIGLSQEVPGTQVVLRVTHDLPADAVLQPDDLSEARVSLPQEVAATTFSSDQVDLNYANPDRTACSLPARSWSSGSR